MRAEHCVDTISPGTALNRREVLIVKHMPDVRIIAASVRHMFPPSIEFQDLVQCGCLGLIEAADRYNPSRGDFAPYAYHRIRGAIIDAHKRKAYREEQHDSLEALQGAGGRKAHGFDDVDRSPMPDALAIVREMLALAEKAIEFLPDDERAVLGNAHAGAKLKDIAAAYGHSVSWVWVRLARGRKKVAAAMKEQRIRIRSCVTEPLRCNG